MEDITINSVEVKQIPKPEEKTEEPKKKQNRRKRSEKAKKKFFQINIGNH